MSSERRISWLEFQSTTKQESIARGLAQATDIIVQIRTFSAKNITPFGVSDDDEPVSLKILKKKRVLFD